MPKTKRHLPLCKSDLADLRGSGLNDATIRANRLRTEDDALVFPYRGLSGEVNCFSRTKPHRPRTIDGKTVKYEQPKGTKLRAYFPASSVRKLRNPTLPIYITEGEKKALALGQLRLAAIGLGGVYCWKLKGSDELIPDLAAIDWADREVYIVFDFDAKATTRQNVDAARRRLAKALRAAGAAEVYNVVLPPGPNVEKCGVDDFLVAEGAEAFHDLVEQAQPVPPIGPPPIRRAEGRTDAINAARLVERFGNDIRWVGPWDRWLVWDDRRWRVDDELKIQALAKQVASDLWTELSTDIKGVAESTAKAMLSFCTASNGQRGINAMVSLARSEPGVAIGIDELDADPYRLNVENGTLDLRTGKLRVHQRSDFLTKLAPVTFDPEAECPTWLKFLETIFDGRSELIGYVQRLVGYSITGSTEEHILPFLYGTGANGKSTFCELALKALGPDYGMKAAPDLLMAKRGESHPTERADLWGKRLVACIETEAGRRMAEALVKELTGGDRIRARRMREDFWEFAPTHHVWLSSNYKPVVIGTDHGIWRRIKLIPFDVVIPDDQQDKKLPAKLEAELPGILNWAVEGCLEWQANGMQEPEVVRGQTDEYRDEMDLIGQFLDQQCDRGPDHWSPATRLYKAFIEATGSHMSQAAFGRELGRRGFEKGRITRGRFKGKHGWRGLRLAEDATIDRLAARIRKGK